MNRPRITTAQLIDLMWLKSSDSAWKERIGALGINANDLNIDEHLASCEDRTLGLEISLKDQAMLQPDNYKSRTGVWVVVGVHLHSSGHEGFCEYADKLPLGVSFTQRRGQINDQLGPPCKTGGGNSGPGKKIWPFWDVYNLQSGIYVRYQYSDGQTLQLVTIYTA